MKKRLILAVALASAMPAGAAAPPPAVGADAALLQAPVPIGSIADWLAESTHPVTIVPFSLTVSAGGNVIGCTMESSGLASVGSVAPDDKLCGLLERRGKFRPALNRAGKPVLGVWRGDAASALPGTVDMPLIEMEVMLQKMPQGLPDPAYVDLAVSVDVMGHIDGCATGPAPDRAELILGPTACSEAIRSLKPDTAKNAHGQQGRSVQAARVAFTAKAPTLAAAKPAESEGEILVVGRQIVSRREAAIAYRGFSPIRDFEPIGYEQVLLEAFGGKWYRAKLVPPCIGTLSMMPMGGRTPAMAFITNPDGTFDRFSRILVRGLPPPYFNGRCEIESLVESESPATLKKAAKAARAERVAVAKAAKAKAR